MADRSIYGLIIGIVLAMGVFLGSYSFIIMWLSNNGISYPEPSSAFSKVNSSLANISSTSRAMQKQTELGEGFLTTTEFSLTASIWTAIKMVFSIPEILYDMVNMVTGDKELGPYFPSWVITIITTLITITVLLLILAILLRWYV